MQYNIYDDKQIYTLTVGYPLVAVRSHHKDYIEVVTKSKTSITYKPLDRRKRKRVLRKMRDDNESCEGS